MQRTSMGGQQAWLCKNFIVACEASGAREHGQTQSMKHQVEGPIMQGKEWMRAFGRCNSWSTRARRTWRRMIVLEESRGGERHAATQASRPRPADLPYKRSPSAPVFCRQASLSFFSLCAQVFVPRTTVDIANLPKLDSLLTVQNRSEVHRKPTGDLVPFSPRRVLPRFVNPRIGSKPPRFSI
jgi:hypothetical protein